MSTDNPELLNGLTLDEVLQRWFKYDSRSSEPEFALIAMTVTGYKANVVVLECEWEEAQRRNLARGRTTSPRITRASSM